MRFDSARGHAVLAGSKTTVRRPARRWADCAETDRQRSASGLGPYLPGTTHALSFPHIELDGYGQPMMDYATGTPRRMSARSERIQVTSAELGHVGDVDGNSKALKAEGFSYLEDFALEWVGCYDGNPETRIAARGRHLDGVIDYWRDRHASRLCWVIRLQVMVPEKVLLLAEQQGISHAGSYTSNPSRAMSGEPEAIDPRTIIDTQRAFESEQRWTVDRVGREAAYARLPIHQRVELALAAARTNGIDASSFEFQLNRHLTQLERRVARTA